MSDGKVKVLLSGPSHGKGSERMVTRERAAELVAAGLASYASKATAKKAAATS